MDIQAIIQAAKAVIQSEIVGLQSIASVMDHEFGNIILMASSIRGKVITVGIGKSGIIARKFAATLASTGTQALFLHPVEAVHGDLGVVGTDDMVFFLSNSGESAELNQVVQYCKRFGITTIGMSRNSDSSMTRECDYSIIIPNIAEASQLPAPTTSTTMMLATCDAIAIALAELKGFSAADFKLFHPGGNIGAKLTRVEEVMHAGHTMPLVKKEAMVSAAILEIASKRLGCVGVVDEDGKLLGMVTDGDLRKHSHMDYRNTIITDVMTAKPWTLNKSVLVAEALHKFNMKKITNGFVVDEHMVPIGIVHIHDLLKVRS
jgi:arabinose-5-phosphate isomerase